ncbi:PRC-barrel domain-containing protein [Limimaricola sp.]|uniref:PRC-barrel domain-containing protein n=1 Tax=Limimaricola sp. TaxID=2211665 RepID=UPI0040585F26
MKLLTASALALSVTATGALAESHAMDETMAMTSADMAAMQGDLIRTRDITDGPIYTLNEADDEGWDTVGTYDELGADWNEIGEIEDVVLSRDGKMVGVVAEVGGFLDIADKHVMLPTGDVRLVAVDDKSYAIVTRLSEEELESLEGVDEGFWD